MNSANRIFVNTLAQYLRAVLNIGLSFYSTRLILDALGISDYGIYSLIAGVVSMLSFVTNALVITTQRFLSFYQGKGSIFELRKIFSNSLLIHLVIGIVFVIIIEFIGFFLFDGFLNIPIERIYAAIRVFHCIVFILLLNFITAPFRALIISRENIVFLSVIDVADGFLKVIIALLLPLIAIDYLVAYGLLLSTIYIFNLIVLTFFCFRRYEECSIPKRSYLSLKVIKDLTSFASWTVYSIGCIIIRTQGIAVLLNLYFGPTVNAAYGLAVQIGGNINFLSQSILNAFNPRIMMKEGEGKRDQMLRLSEIASKFSFILLTAIVVPLIVEMPDLLRFWLKEVPDNSVFFCRMILVASILDQITIGLGSANQAIGRIRSYSLIVNTVKVLTVPASWIALKIGLSISSIFIIFIFFEFGSAILRLIVLRTSGDLSISGFFRRVLLKVVIPFIAIMLISIFIKTTINLDFRFILNYIISIIVFLFSIYFYGLCNDEKDFISGMVMKIVNKLKIL